MESWGQHLIGSVFLECTAATPQCQQHGKFLVLQRVFWCKTSSSHLSFSCIQTSRSGVNTNSNSPHSAPPIRDNIRATTNDNAHVTNNDPGDDGVGNEGEVEEDVVDVDIADDNVVNVDDSGVEKEKEETNEEEDRSDSSETIISKEIAETIVSCKIHKGNAC